MRSIYVDTEPDPERLCEAFGLGRPVEPLLRITKPDRSSAVWKLRTDEGAFAVKRTRWDTPGWWYASARTAVDLERRSHAAGVDCPEAVEPAGSDLGVFALIGGAPFHAHSWVDARAVGPFDDITEWIGTTLAALHSLCPASAPDRDAYGLHPLVEWESWIDRAASQARPWADLARSRLGSIAATSDYIEETLARATRFVVTHRDFNPWNVLVADDGPLLVDFDHAGVDCAWLELVSSAFEFAFLGRDEADPDVIARIVAAYLASGGQRDDIPRDRALARWLGSKLMWIAWNMWRSLGDRPTTAVERAEADEIVLEELATLPSLLGETRQWAELLPS